MTSDSAMMAIDSWIAGRQRIGLKCRVLATRDPVLGQWKCQLGFMGEPMGKTMITVDGVGVTLAAAAKDLARNLP